MRRVTAIIISCFFILLQGGRIIAQENIFGQYFIANSFYNPALAGDTRFAQVQIAERIQPTVSNIFLTNSMVSYDQKIPNHRSGLNFYLAQETSTFKEQHIKINYSYTLPILKKIWIKSGFGISYNSINTHANTYKYPDQYDTYGYTGQPTQEILQQEKAAYPGFSLGFAAYNDLFWFTLGTENLNRPGVEIIEGKYTAPLIINSSMGLLIAMNKKQLTRRIFNRYGGIEPYSSIGPVVSYFKNGPFNVISFGVNTYINPIFGGINYNYNSMSNNFFSEGTASLNIMAGYRIQSLSVAYSYDLILTRTPTNYKGAHEISFSYYFYAYKEDYKRNKLFPFCNQLMY